MVSLTRIRRAFHGMIIGECGISLIECLAGMIMLSLGLLTLLPLATISISRLADLSECSSQSYGCRPTLTVELSLRGS